MSDRDFEIGSKKFKLNKLNALKQFHIARRVTPILADLLPYLKDFKLALTVTSESEKLEQFAKIATPFMNGISKLSNADSELVLIGLLSCVEVQQSSGNWARIANDEMIMIQDLDLPVLLQAAGRGFIYNMKGFFDGLPAQLEARE